MAGTRMTLPSILIGFIFASLYGTLFHAIRGGGFWRIPLYILLAWIGFWGGHFIGNSLSVQFATLGPLQLGTATLGAFGLLLVGAWLTNFNPETSR